ncbi:NAD(P)-binding domain protein [Apiospora phragmitis]|uniref:3beta-hydroxysteroid 3-dehydrogenase n=1 Tax=Apiospora phragmitis TaxID=2905665 RepID=A0ABR1W6U5_9PEZI
MDPSKGTILLTGSNGGLGNAIVRQLASPPNGSVYYGLYAVRDATAAPALRSTLAGYPSHQHDVVSLDLTKLDGIRQTANAINARIAAGEVPPIRALILNAGYQNLNGQIIGDDGLDYNFTVNYLGHWLLALLLLQSMDKACGRIVVVGSDAHDPQSKLNTTIKPVLPVDNTLIPDRASFEALAKGTWGAASDPPWRAGYRRYAATKLCAMTMVHELQRRLAADPALNQIRVLAVDPGYMSTGLQRRAPWAVRLIVFQVLLPLAAWLAPGGPFRAPETSAAHVLRAALDELELELGGELGARALYFDGAQPAETSVESRDVGKLGLVWKGTVRLTGLRKGESILQDWS